MDVSTRVAEPADLAWLTEADRHLAPDAQALVIASGRVLLAEVGATPVGLLRWGLFWDEVPFVHLLWVVEAHRGLGTGTALLHAWESARAAEGHDLALISCVSSERSQRLFRRLGYVDCGALLLPDEAAELILRKELTRSPART